MSILSSFNTPIDALVVGANGGIGRAFIDKLLGDANVRRVHAWSRQTCPIEHEKLSPLIIDIGDETQLKSAADTLEKLDLVIVASGILHNDQGLFPEKSYKNIDPQNMAEGFLVNTIFPALVAKHTLPRLPRHGRSIFCALSARVGSISDNRLGGWYTYRAGKAALNQIIKCLSIELHRTHKEAVCIGLHPGTVNTALSEPFQKSLATGHKLFTPEKSALHLLSVINNVTIEQSGSLLAWNSDIIPA